MGRVWKVEESRSGIGIGKVGSRPREEPPTQERFEGRRVIGARRIEATDLVAERVEEVKDSSVVESDKGRDGRRKRERVDEVHLMSERFWSPSRSRELELFSG